MIQTQLPEVTFWEGDEPVCSLRCIPPNEGEMVVLKYDDGPMSWWRVEHRRMEIVRVLGEALPAIAARWIVVISPLVETRDADKRSSEEKP